MRAVGKWLREVEVGLSESLLYMYNYLPLGLDKTKLVTNAAFIPSFGQVLVEAVML